jgi:hypothetical protein
MQSNATVHEIAMETVVLVAGEAPALIDESVYSSRRMSQGFVGEA